MRKIKTAAIQPKYINIPLAYNCLSRDYINRSNEILEQYLLPQLQVTLNLLEEAGRQGCGIVTTSEDLNVIGDYVVDITEKNIFPELVEKSQEITESALSEIAEKYSMYIVACYYKKYGDKIYNVTSIFGRDGTICGEYRKTHMPPYEKWQCSEGDDIEIFELDFGTIGICICYDIMFPEFSSILALKGAEIIFHPTLGYGWYDNIGEATIRTRANDCGVYIVTAKNYIFCGAGKSGITDYWGHIIADAGFRENTVISATLDLDEKKLQPKWHYSTATSGGVGDVAIRKLAERRPDIYSTLSTKIHDELELPSLKEKKEIFSKIESGKLHW